MGELGAIRGAEWCRGWLAAVLLAVFAVLLTACSAGSILTNSGPASSANPKGKTVPPVTYQQIAGIPPDKLTVFKQSLATAGGQHDIGFVEGNLKSGVFSIGGSLRAIPGNAGVRVVYEWQFRDADGVLIDTLTGEDNAGVYSGADPWGAVTPDVLDRVARRTADLMAQRLSAMGYAARLSSLTRRPAELFARAGPTAGRQIDFETVHGPGLGEIGTMQLANADEVVQHEDIKPWVAAVSPHSRRGTDAEDHRLGRWPRRATSCHRRHGRDGAGGGGARRDACGKAGEAGNRRSRHRQAWPAGDPRRGRGAGQGFARRR